MWRRESEVDSHVWLGYAAFQGSARLLDFGVTNFRIRESGVLRLSSLLEVFRPANVVVRKIARRSKRNRPATKAFIRSVERECQLRSIRVVLVSEARLRREFRARGVANKREDAASFAQRFPELDWRVPPPRKLWHHETSEHADVRCCRSCDQLLRKP